MGAFALQIPKVDMGLVISAYKQTGSVSAGDTNDTDDTLGDTAG